MSGTKEWRNIKVELTMISRSYNSWEPSNNILRSNAVGSWREILRRYHSNN
jgi:hypothetical protein